MALRTHPPMDRHLARSLPDESVASGLRRRSTMRVAAQSIGTLALGAIAIGALAMGALAIGRLAVGRARIRRLEIDELVVRRLRVVEQLQAPPKAGPKS